MNAERNDIEDLLLDESFINYCRQSEPGAVAFWEDFIRMNPEKAGLVESAKERFIGIFSAIAIADLEKEAERLSDSLTSSAGAPVIEMEQPLKKKRGKILGLIIKISAAAIMLGAIYFTIPYINKYFDNSKTFVAVSGERKNIQLPDGSYVTLNAASTIQIHDDFGKIARDVYLQGEAFFDVKHDGKIPFIVHTAAMDIKALGTAFNVKAYEMEKFTEAALIKGLVEVTLKEQHNATVLLHPNEKIKWQRPAPVNPVLMESNGLNQHANIAIDSLKKKIIKGNDCIIKEIAWKSNRLIFEDESFEEIAMLLERWYNAKIDFQDSTVSGYRFTGIFEKEDLITVLDLLKESRDFNYAVEQGQITTINLSK